MGRVGGWKQKKSSDFLKKKTCIRPDGYLLQNRCSFNHQCISKIKVKKCFYPFISMFIFLYYLQDFSQVLRGALQNLMGGFFIIIFFIYSWLELLHFVIMVSIYIMMVNSVLNWKWKANWRQLNCDDIYIYIYII